MTFERVRVDAFFPSQLFRSQDDALSEFFYLYFGIFAFAIKVRFRFYFWFGILHPVTLYHGRKASLCTMSQHYKKELAYRFLWSHRTWNKIYYDYNQIFNDSRLFCRNYANVTAVWAKMFSPANLHLRCGFVNIKWIIFESY